MDTGIIGISIAIEKLLNKHRQDRDPFSHSRLEIHSGETDSGITPDVHMQSASGLGKFGAHRQPETVTELRRLAPTDIGQRRDRLPKWRQLIARAARIVRNDRVR